MCARAVTRSLSRHSAAPLHAFAFCIVQPKVRDIMARFEGLEVPETTIESLCLDIDRIYSAKIGADASADQSRAPRRELVDFVVDFYLEDLGSVGLAQERLCSILRCLMKAERTQAGSPLPLKVGLFARFLQFCDLEQSLPGTVLGTVLQTKRFAQANYIHNQEEKPNAQPSATQARNLRPGQEAAAAYVPPDARISAADAYEAGERALNGTMGSVTAALRQLFSSVARFSELEGFDARRWHSRDFVVFVHLVHHSLHRELAPRFRELITRAEQRTSIPVEDFRAALRDMRLQMVDESVWRPRLTPQSAALAATAASATVAADTVLEYFGGGSSSRLPPAVLSESSLLTSITEAACAEYSERSRPLRRLWDRRVGNSTAEKLQYKDVSALVRVADHGIATKDITALYQQAVDLSRACTQIDGDAMPLLGLDSCVGGDAIAWDHLYQAAFALRLFMTPTSGGGGSGGGAGGQAYKEAVGQNQDLATSPGAAVKTRKSLTGRTSTAKR
eukprot:TRINITY_DN14124_c0_g2_i3.p1 TRINITY_DN14124_c0_g2~~TRINITY_DN14124_c0_g2_i3.p1  ORF type:complete len:506 (-),score=110.66 TRINITY_DN14124_c0_g2_i3:76-1593(-)